MALRQSQMMIKIQIDSVSVILITAVLYSAPSRKSTHELSQPNLGQTILWHLCASKISYSCRVEIRHLKVVFICCIVSIHLYSASCSAHQSEALPVRETQREESSLERTKRGTWLTS